MNRRAFAGAAVGMLGGAAPAIADTAREVRPLDRVLALGRVRVAVREDGPPPGAAQELGEPAGVELAVARLVAEGLGVQLELVPVAPLERLSVLGEGRADVSFSGLTITEARVPQALFLNPYARLEFGVAGPAARPLRGVNDVQDLRIGVVPGEDSVFLAETMLPGNVIRRPFPSGAACIAGMLRGEVDAIIDSRPALGRALARARATEFTYHFTLRASWMAGAVGFGQHDLLRAINAILFIGRSRGDLGAISQLYLGYPLGQPPQI